MQKANLPAYTEQIYKDYSLYVLQNRAVPHILDGLKTSQRKALACAIKYARSQIKVSALSGYVIATENYCHGDSSLNSLISYMGASYTGGNNYPLFTGYGAFGTKLEETPAAARYIAVKLSTIFDKIFPAIDFKILTATEPDENPESDHFLPIIPYAAVNGIAGIAVGYATKILPFAIEDICNYMKAKMSGKKTQPLLPWFKGYKIPVYRDAETQKFIMEGHFTKPKKNIIVVDEVPVSYSLDKYHSYLNKLMENGKIRDYTCRSKKDWEIEIEVDKDIWKKTDKQLIELLGLKSILSENINFIDTEGKVQHYTKIEDYIDAFMSLREKFYDKRKNYILYKNDEQLLNLSIKILMNAYGKLNKNEISLEGTLAYVNKSKKEITLVFDRLSNSKVNLSNIEKVTTEVFGSIGLREMTDASRVKFEKEREELLKERELYFSRSIKDIWVSDINDLLKNI